MIFLNNEFSVPNEVKTAFLQGANFFGQNMTRLGNRPLKELKYSSLNVEHIKVWDWKRLSQNVISEPIPHPISMNWSNGMSLFGGELYGSKTDTSVPEFQVENADNIMSDILASAILKVCLLDFQGGYGMFQTWLFMLSNFNANPMSVSEFIQVERNVVGFNL